MQFNGERVTRLGEIVPDIEHYFDDDGQIKIRPYQGAQGSWVYVPSIKKMVRKSSGIATIPTTIVGWRESNAGYYDEDLGCHINSKTQLRQEMKKQGLVFHDINSRKKSARENFRDKINSETAKKELYQKLDSAYRRNYH